MKLPHAIHWVVIPLLGLTACGRPSEPTMRRYREVYSPPPPHAEQSEHGHGAAGMPPAASGASDMTAPGAPAVAAANAEVHWTTPEGWVEQLGNPMRIATFLVGPDQLECTLTAFPGAVGGIEENLTRWAGQLNITLAAPDLAKFARTPKTTKTEGEFPCLIYDFSSVAPDAEPSMLAAILPLETRTLFVKFTGPQKLLADQKEAFTALCQSLRP